MIQRVTKLYFILEKEGNESSSKYFSVRIEQIIKINILWHLGNKNDNLI